MKNNLMLGVDIGTTSTKTVAFTLDGQVVAQHAVEYPLLCTAPGMAEQDPLQIYQAVLDSIAQALQAVRAKGNHDGVALVSFSAAMHSVIAIGPDQQPLTNSITWADNRASVWAGRIKNEHDGNAIYRRTGTPIHPMSPLCKLMWLREDQPQLFAATARFAGVKEYVFFRLFGQWLVDYSDCLCHRSVQPATTGMGRGRAGADRRCACAAVDTGTDHASSARTGCGGRGATRFAGRHAVCDRCQRRRLVESRRQRHSSGPGRGHHRHSGAMRTVIDKPVTDASGRTFCYALTPDHWVVGGPVNNGGNIFRWVRDELATAEAETARQAGIDPYDALTRIAEQVTPGAEGLLFHPFMAGERAPLWNADLRGSFFGLALHHRKEHMIRAALEGVIFNLYSILPAVEDLIGPTRRMMATGGFARSALWRQMMADIFNREVVVPESVESSCLGAAVLGLYALGLVRRWMVISDMVGSTNRHLPIAANVAIYERLRPIFMALPGKLEQEYLALAAFQRDAPTP